jgi:ATP-dependent RNA helicase DeaD
MIKTFKELKIKDYLIQALTENKIDQPTEIQIKSIPFLLENGTDFIGQAQTGTGKTLAFGLPLLQRIIPEDGRIQGVILSPTRELGQQIAKQLFKMTKHCPEKIFIESVYGGEKIDIQIKALSRPTHIVVATPGRLVDLLDRKVLDISQVETVVLDEADEMLSMGFKDELDQILRRIQGSRNTWLFSATLPDGIQEIIDNYLDKSAFRVNVTQKNIVNTNIVHQYVVCNPNHKLSALFQFLKVQGRDSGIIFCRTKAGAQYVTNQLLERKISADTIHGDLQQREREKAMRAFKNHKIQLLVTTDVSARGIDVDDLCFVIHYDLPEKLEYYTHRSGRTARAGKKGVSICMIEGSEIRTIRKIEQNLKIKFEKIGVK